MKRLLLIVSFLCAGQVVSNEAEQQVERTYTLELQGGKLEVDEKFIDSFLLTQGVSEDFLSKEDFKDPFGDDDTKNRYITLFANQLVDLYNNKEIWDNLCDQYNKDKVLFQIMYWHFSKWVMQQRLGVVDNDNNPEDGHTSFVNSVCVSADGKTVISGSSDNTVIVWQKNAEGHSWLQQRLGVVDNDRPEDGHIGNVTSVCVSADGQTVVSGSWDKTVIVWQKNDDGQWTKQRLGVVDNHDRPEDGHVGAVSSVCVSVDGKTVVSGSWDNTVIVWQKNDDGQWTKQRLGVVNNGDHSEDSHTGSVNSVCVSADGQTVVSGSADKDIIVWQKNEEDVWQMIQRLGGVNNNFQGFGHTDTIYSVALSQDGQTIVSGSDDRSIIIWKKNEKGVWQMAQRLGEAGNHDQNVGHVGLVCTVALSKDDQTIVSGSTDTSIIVWGKNEVGQWEKIKRLGPINNQETKSGDINWVNSVALSKDGQTIISGFEDGTIVVWGKNEKGKWVIANWLGEVDNDNKEFGHVGSVKSVALSQDGQTIISGSKDHTIIVWKKQSVQDCSRGKMFDYVEAVKNNFDKNIQKINNRREKSNA